MRLKLLLFILTLILFGGTAHAATSSNSISVNMVPSNPAPYEDTTITLSSYTYSLDSVSITWSVDGKTALSGIQPTHYSYSYVESKTPPDITNVSPTIDVTNSPRQESYHKQDFRSNQYEYRNEYYGNCPYCKR